MVTYPETTLLSVPHITYILEGDPGGGRKRLVTALFAIKKRDFFDIVVC